MLQDAEIEENSICRGRELGNKCVKSVGLSQTLSDQMLTSLLTSNFITYMTEGKTFNFSTSQSLLHVSQYAQRIVFVQGIVVIIK